MNYYVDVLKRYVDFDGRARRKELWMFFLINFGINIVLTIITLIIPVLGFISSLYGLAILLPSLGVGARRLHDIGKSGWWLLIGLVPLVGQIWLIVLWATDGQRGDNEFGPDPKADEIAAM